MTDKMFVLMLNDMRTPKVEVTSPVCKAQTVEDLEDLIKQETVLIYKDPKWSGADIEKAGQWWGKTFRKGGPLEWFNQPWRVDPRRKGVGCSDNFIVVDSDDIRLGPIPTIPELWK